MEEIAASFEAAGLPGGFHRAAADIYRKLEAFKDGDAPPALGAVIAAIRRGARRKAPSGETRVIRPHRKTGGGFRFLWRVTAPIPAKSEGRSGRRAMPHRVRARGCRS